MGTATEIDTAASRDMAPQLHRRGEALETKGRARQETAQVQEWRAREVRQTEERARLEEKSTSRRVVDTTA